MGEDRKNGVTDGKTSGEDPIQNGYSLSCIKRSSGNKAEVESYEKSIKELGDFKTVQGFWRIYNYLVRPNELPNTMDYHLFKTDIKPMWEDPANRKGGKWMIRVRKGIASRYWEDLILAIIGEQFDVGNEICGAVVSIRFSEDVISLWNRNADNVEACHRIRDTMRKVLNLPHFVIPEYKRHDASLGDNTSSTAARTTNAVNNTNAANTPTNSNNNGTSAWRDQRGSNDRSNNGEERRGFRSSNTSQDRSSSSRNFPRNDRERSDHRGGERNDRGGDRSTNANSSRSGGASAGNAWSRDNKRPIFTKTGGVDGENSNNAAPSGASEGAKKPAPANPWGQMQ